MKYFYVFFCENYNKDAHSSQFHIATRHFFHTFAFLLSMPGAPYIYYGNEIGMRYIEGLTSKEGGYNRTGARSPIQWDDSENAGFSSAPADKLYIPLDPDVSRPTAKAQMSDERSLRSEIKKLIDVQLNHAMIEATGDKTVIFISHRLSTTRIADRIIMLEKGCIVEQGTHEELLSMNGKYAQMWKVQAGAYIAV